MRLPYPNKQTSTGQSTRYFANRQEPKTSTYNWNSQEVKEIPETENN